MLDIGCWMRHGRELPTMVNITKQSKKDCFSIWCFQFVGACQRMFHLLCVAWTGSGCCLTVISNVLPSTLTD